MVVQQRYEELLRAFIRKKKKGSHFFQLTVQDKKEIQQEIEKQVRAVSEKDAALSVNTLNRFFSGRSIVKPTMHTLDQLSRYAGFPSWNEFVKLHPLPGEAILVEYDAPSDKLHMRSSEKDVDKTDSATSFISLHCCVTPAVVRFPEPILLQGRWTFNICTLKKNGEDYKFAEKYNLIAKKNGSLNLYLPVSGIPVKIYARINGGWYYKSIERIAEYDPGGAVNFLMQFKATPRNAFRWIESLIQKIEKIFPLSPPA